MLSSLQKLSMAAVVVTGSAGWVWSQQPPKTGPAPVAAPRPPVAPQPPGDVLIPNTLPPSAEIVEEPIPSQFDPSAVRADVRNVIRLDQPQNKGQFHTKLVEPAHRFLPRTRTVVEYIAVPVSEEERSETAELQKAVETLKSSSPQEEKDGATKTLSGILEKQFNRDLERREKEVAELEERVKKLREQVTKRKDAKDDIIKLRLTTITNEAAGLGFPGTGEPKPQELGGDVQYFAPSATTFTVPIVPGAPVPAPTPTPGPRYTPLSR